MAGTMGNAPDWTIGFQPVTQETLNAPLTVRHGRLPDGLRGTFYRNGPARHELGGRRYHHWFDADGMVQAFRFTDDGVAHHGRFVETPKHAAEREAGRFRYPAFGTPLVDPRSAEPDTWNTANTNVVPHHGRLLALWEGGSAHALAPDDLRTEGPVAWSEDTAGWPFSAHPHVEPDGTMWNFGMNAAEGALALYEIAPDGRPRRVQSFELPGGVPMIHDFVVTDRHLVFVLPPFHFHGWKLLTKNCVLDCFRWEPRKGTRVLVVDKADWGRRRWFELPPSFIFHFGGGWDDGDCIRLDYERYRNPDVVTKYARRVMKGKPFRLDAAAATQAVLDLRNGTAREDGFAASSEFPRIHPDRVGQRYRYRYSVASDGTHGHPFQNGVRRLDMETGAQATYCFGPDAITEEHVVVPKPSARGEGDAWLVGTMLDTASGRTRLNVFDARAIGDGPVFQAELPYALPLGFHGNFAPAT